MDGRVIGVNSQIATSTGDYNGIGFALPSNEAANVYRQIVSFGKVKRGYLGVYLDSVGKEFASVYGLENSNGAIITSVRDKDGAAAKAGLKDNDIILTLDRKSVLNAQDLIAKVASTPPGKDITIGFLREVGENLVAKTVTVRLAERPGNDLGTDLDRPTKLPLSDGKVVRPFGLMLEFVEGKTADENRFKGRKGLLVRRIDPSNFLSEERSSNGSPALLRGDLIERINRKPVTDLESFKKLVSEFEVGDAVVLHVSSYDRDSARVIPRIVQFTVK
jgi:serine protease Do